MSQGGEWFEVELEDGTFLPPFWWPRCTIAGCPNFICRNESDRFCWPHMSSGKTLPEMIVDLKEKVKVGV